MPGVTVVSSIRTGTGQAFGEEVDVNGVDPDIGEVVDMTWASGSGDVAARLGGDGAFVKDDYAEEHDLELGSPIQLKTPTGEVLDLQLEGIFAEPKGGSPFGTSRSRPAPSTAPSPSARTSSRS